MAQAQLRVQRADERLYELRTQVAARVTPQQVEVLAKASGGLRPATNEVPLEIAALDSSSLGHEEQVARERPAQGTTGKPSKTPRRFSPQRPAPQRAAPQRLAHGERL